MICERRCSYGNNEKSEKYLYKYDIKKWRNQKLIIIFKRKRKIKYKICNTSAVAKT